MNPLCMYRDEALIEELRARGYISSRDDGTGWVTPAQLSSRFSFHPNYVSRLVNRGTTIPGLELHRANAGKGRLLMVRASPATENWMRSRRKAVTPVYDY